MKAGEADVGMKRRGSQLRKQNIVKLLFFISLLQSFEAW